MLNKHLLRNEMGLTD